MRLLRNLSLLALLTALPQFASTFNLPPFPVNATQDSNTPYSFFSIVFSGIGPGYDVYDGIDYLGWCAEQEATIVDFTPTVTLYNTIDPATPTQGNLALPGGFAGKPWPIINYVLNHKVGSPSDVQYVIWYFMNGGTVTSLSPTAATAAMIADATANGTSFVPNASQTEAVLLYQDGYGLTFQDTLIEVRLPEPGTILMTSGGLLLIILAGRRRAVSTIFSIAKNS